MANSHPIATLIPWYVNDTLDEGDRRKVEQHLPTCDRCRSLLEDAQQLAGLGQRDPDLLLGHVQAQHLERFAVDPSTLEAELASWIRSHVAGCEACAGAVELLRRPVGGAAAEPRAHGDNVLATLWHLAARTVLHPAAATVYLLLVVVSIPAYRSLTRLPRMEGRVETLEQRLDALRDWGGIIDLPVVTGPLRGAAASLVVTRTAEQPVLGLGVEFELPEQIPDSSRLVIALSDESGAVVWSAELTAGGARRHLGETGLVTLLIPGDRALPGSYRLTVEPAARSGRALLDAGLDIVLGTD